jgi:dipeptidase
MRRVAPRTERVCGDKRLKEVGKAFSYGVGLRDDKSVWIMLLYGCHLWIAVTGEPPEGFVGETL